MKPTLFGRPNAPGEARGFLPLLVAALSAARGVYGAIDANQRSQRNKGYIEDSYRDARQRLQMSQANSRESEAEGLAARGLAQGGDIRTSPINTVMRDGYLRATGVNPSTLGGQEQSDTGVQMGLEQKDLEQQKSRALKENRAARTEAYIGAGMAGVNTAMSLYGAKGDVDAGNTADAGTAAMTPPIGQLPGASYIPTAAPKFDRSSIHSMMLAQSSFGKIHPNDPTGAPESAWSTHPTISGENHTAQPGESNASFNG